MITIMRKYENPMLQVVSIKKNDIVCTSPQAAFDPTQTMGDEGLVGAADRFRDFDAGY